MANMQAVAGLRRARDDAIDVIRADMNRKVLELELALRTEQSRRRAAETLVSLEVHFELNCRYLDVKFIP